MFGLDTKYFCRGIWIFEKKRVECKRCMRLKSDAIEIQDDCTANCSIGVGWENWDTSILGTAEWATLLLPNHRCYGHNLTSTFSVWCMTSGSSLDRRVPPHIPTKKRTNDIQTYQFFVCVISFLGIKSTWDTWDCHLQKKNKELEWKEKC